MQYTKILLKTRVVNTQQLGAGEIVQRLRAMGTPVKDQGSVHSPHTVAHKPFATPFREVLMPCSDLPGQQAWMWSHTHMYTTHTHS